MKALIDCNNLVVQIVRDDDLFEVHESLKWVNCPDDCKEGWCFNGERTIPPLPLSPEEVERQRQPGMQEIVSALWDAVANNDHFALNKLKKVMSELIPTAKE